MNEKDIEALSDATIEVKSQDLSNSKCYLAMKLASEMTSAGCWAEDTFSKMTTAIIKEFEKHGH